ncbi:hypothetical protein DVS28_b0215 (plasmid) [Euzebya pacifica]|uniref:Uncharacterized protein n=1 Tax=Euzebya pacifica TaxID=1608957 RepID=A0A346Y688_9ACTN|nr:hypothetical protein DVS28_b0215 [Euzebya pacifica]
MAKIAFGFLILWDVRTDGVWLVGGGVVFAGHPPVRRHRLEGHPVAGAADAAVRRRLLHPLEPPRDGGAR